MIKILIADDEYHIRNGIIQFIPWREMHIEIAGEAADGFTALSIFEREKPNILLLDINMPGVSGLELAKKVRSQDTKAQIIFLTGYDDFAKAKEALLVQASDYLLKPVSYGELIHALTKASSKIAEVMKKDEYVFRLEQKFHDVLPVASERIFLDWLQNQRSLEDAKALLGDLGITIVMQAEYVVYAIEIDEFSRYMDEVSQRDRELYLYAYKKLAQEVLEYDGRTVHILHVSPSRLIIIATVDDRPLGHEANDAIGKLRRAYRNFLKLSVTIGVSLQCSSAAALPTAYKQAVLAVDQRTFIGGGTTIPYHLAEPAVASGKRLLGKELYLLSEIRCGNDTNVLNTLNDWCHELSELPLLDAKMIASQLLLFVMRLMKEAEVKIELEREDPLGNVLKCETSIAVTECVATYVMKVGKAMHMLSNRPSMKVMKNAKQWIHEHIGEEISLSKLSDYLHMSPNYVSTLFKQSTGETFIEYVTRTRFERAKQLLSNSQLRMHEIASSVGFADANYFSIAFKKYHGFTPSEFRQKYS
jgi:two-component system, response regulator YesN